MKRTFILIVALLLSLAMVLVIAPVAFAQTGIPPVATAPGQPTPIEPISFVALLISITGFCKQQFKLQGYWVIVAGFVVALLLGFLPDIQALMPGSAAWVEKFFLIVKLTLGGLGSYDTLVNVGAKIKTATVDKTGVLSTSEIPPTKVG